MRYTRNPLLVCSAACVAFLPLTGLAQATTAAVVAQYEAKETPYLTTSGKPSYYSYSSNGVTVKKVQATMAYRLLKPAGFDVTKKYPVLITLHGATGFVTPEQTSGYNVRNLRTVNGHLVGYDPSDAGLDKFIQLKDLVGKSAAELNAFLDANPVSLETFLLAKYTPKGVPLTAAQFTPSDLLKFATTDYPDLSKFSDRYPAIQSQFPTYVIAPQGVNMWSANDLLTVKSIIAGLPAVDMDRIYVVGQSAGGQGTYTFISADPAYFAGAIAVSALGSRVSAADRLKLVNFNLWSLHGDNDGTIQYSADLGLFNDMKSKSSRMKFTTVNGRGHSTENLILSRYGDSGSFVELNNAGAATEGLVRYNYNTQYAGANGDRESDTLTWLFSKRRLPNYIQYNAWSNVKSLKQGPYGDDDADGKTNYAEFVAGTDPLSASSK